MREILFRGKRIDNGEWVEGIPWIFSKPVEKAIIVYAMGLVGEDDDVSRYCESYEVDPSTVCMCVPGITDNKGKKIFEGDIVRNHNGQIYEMVFIEKYNCYYFVRESSVYAGIKPKDIEVIGNIHDNPELLEVEE